MTTSTKENNLIFYNEKFGLITENQLIINNGSQKNIINFDSISRVNLIKKRINYYNFISFFLCIIVFVYSIFMFDIKKLELFFAFIFLGIILLVITNFIRFHSYRLVIKEKNQTTFEVKTNDFHRKSIKEFYYSITQKISKK